jgi:hypothetical protein
MAIHTAQVARTGVPAAPASGPGGLFGTGPARPSAAEPAGAGATGRAADRAADRAGELARSLAVGLAVGVLGVEPDHVPTTGRPAPSRRRGLGRRLRTWGAGADGAHLAWRATPLRVYRLGDGKEQPIRPGSPVVEVGRSARRQPAPTPVPDPDLEAAIEFATDVTVDLLRSPARLVAPAPRLTAPLRHLVSGLRGLTRQAASWGAGTHGSRLSWARPVPPRVHALTLPPLPEPAPVAVPGSGPARPAPPRPRGRPAGAEAGAAQHTDHTTTPQRLLL